MKMLKAQFKTSLTTEKHEPIATDTIQWQCGAKRAQKKRAAFRCGTAFSLVKTELAYVCVRGKAG
jgi:hypothetical protein